MENSIYCSPTHMKIVIGSADAKAVRIEDFGEVVLPQDGIINGIITDEAVMTKFFRDVRESMNPAKNTASLIIHTNNIQTKRMDVPPVSEAQIRQFIRSEFGEYDTDTQTIGQNPGESYVYDYSVIEPHSESGGASILAAGVPRDFLGTYIRCLENAGYDLVSASIGLVSYIRVAMFFPEQMSGDFVLLHIDRRNMSSVLFPGGTYQLSNRYRLVNEEGSEEWHKEIGGHLSAMLQFNMTQRGFAKIKTAYVAGLSESELEAFAERHGYLDIDIRPLDLSSKIRATGKAAGTNRFDTGKYLFNLGGLLRR